MRWDDSSTRHIAPRFGARPVAGRSVLLSGVAPSPSPFFFFTDTAPTEVYTLSLHDALPILRSGWRSGATRGGEMAEADAWLEERSEEHTSELQSLAYLVCRLLLEKKKHDSILDLEKHCDKTASTHHHLTTSAHVDNTR